METFKSMLESVLTETASTREQRTLSNEITNKMLKAMGQVMKDELEKAAPKLTEPDAEHKWFMTMSELILHELSTDIKKEWWTPSNLLMRSKK